MPELIPAEPGTPGWLAARRLGVTATDIVSILGIGYKSAYWLYWNKLGQVPDEPDSDRFRLGRYLENYVFVQWAEDNFNDGQNGSAIGSRLYRSTVRPWQMATPDYVLNLGAGPHAVLEVKTWADADRHSWGSGCGEGCAGVPGRPCGCIPPRVRAQVLWQMDVMDVPVGHVGVVFLPSGEFRSYVIEHTSPEAQKAGMNDGVAEDIGFMRERGAEFYARLQGELPPPDIDASAASLAAVKARFSDARKDKTVSVDKALWKRYSLAAGHLDEWTEAKRGIENEIREQVGEAGAIEVDGQLVARRLIYDAKVKAHTRHVDSIRRVKQQGDDDVSA